MLTADLVTARRRQGRLYLPRIDHRKRARLQVIAARYLEIFTAHVGRPRAIIDEICADFETELAPTERRTGAGLRKLLLDRCRFSVNTSVDPAELRRVLFMRAARHRRAMPPGQALDRELVIVKTANDLGLDPGRVENGMFADLKEAHLLASVDPITAASLVQTYEDALGQAVLLRAVKVTLDVVCSSPGGYRRLFHKLKFLRLLYMIEPREESGYRIVIDGPHSLFRAVTKYGLQLAMLIPTLREIGRWNLEAGILWGAQREPLTFHLEGQRDGGEHEPSGEQLPDDVERLRRDFASLESGWSVDRSWEILDLPGVGICVPDLLFSSPTSGARVYLEVMGYWSRQAVWKRVELVEAGLPHRVLFAVSERLRVSEAVLSDDLPGALYVYKGTMRARAILDRLSAMSVDDNSGQSRPESG